MPGPGVNEAGVPDELKDREQWVCWRTECRECDDRYEPTTKFCPVCGEKTTKRPIDPANGRYAKATDSDTWHDFETALDYHRGDGDTDGIGFVFAPDGLVAGVDLDDCLDPETGEIDDWAVEVIQNLDTYTEVSPSGTGLHAYVLGFVPDGGNRNDEVGIEIYDKKRYFTVTGQQLDRFGDLPQTVEQRQQPLKEVHEEHILDDDPDDENDAEPPGEVNLDDQELIERACDAENGDKFERLWNGDTSMHENDHSRADLALLCHLAFWTGGDRSRMERLFEQSGLVRGKWRDREDYRDRTIDAALSSTTDFYDGGSKPAKPAADGGAAMVDVPEPAIEYESVRDRVLQRILIPLDPEKYGEDEKKIKHEVAIDRFVDILLDEYNFVRPREDTRGWRDKLYVYEEVSGIYEPHGEYFIESEAERLLGDFATNQRVNEVVGKVERRARVDPKLLRTDPDRLVVGNGILNFVTGDLDPHTPDEYHKTSVKWDYDPDAECPAIDDFFHDIVEDSDVETLYRLVAHCIYREYAAEKAAMLLGEGQNGKSVFIDLLERFLGRYNVANQSLQALNMKDFSANNLVGKLANFHPDLSDQTVKTMQMFKKLTGRDTIDADVKFERPVKFENYATLIFACNRMPVIEDDTRGNWRRWILIQFPNTFERSDDDFKEKRELMAELTDESEMEGLLARAVEEIQEWANGRRWFPKAPHWRETRRQIRRAAEPVYDFAHICLRESSDDDAYILKDEARQGYRDYAGIEGLPPMDREEFGDKLLNHTDLDITPGQKRINGQRRHVYKGVEFSERGKQLLEDVDDRTETQESLESAGKPEDGGPEERAQFVTRYVSEHSQGDDMVDKNDLLEACSGFGMSYDEAMNAIDKAATRGDIVRTPDNEKYYN